ncbi:PQQ-like beta-propeller repeat protein [Amaricoccus solimangrovi]|uniref:Quinoprotein n=1 Tax=Amaricoccus solimangrovi TaxID=2589815 RepID=A0A501WWW3_9RHOB|nr:PQQ-like beta-propeller repeat protein [Amaricoccus solimangrovi]TPE53759.1 quinoprotein [Amaricoccus solimangrovi]
MRLKIPHARPVHLALAAALLAGCSGEDILPGDRIPIRQVEQPLSETDPSAVRPVAIPAARMNADWTHHNGSAAGRLVNPAFSTAPSPRWSVPIGEGDARRRRILTAPVVAGGLVYTMDAGGVVSALRQSDGQPVWSQSVVTPGQQADNGPGGGFAYADGVLYLTTGFGQVMALDPRTGGRIWTQTMEGPVRAAPTVSGGQVFVVVRDDTGYALDATTGETNWIVRGVGGTGLLGGASVATDGTLAVFPFASGEVLGIVARNGLQVWGTAVTGGRRELARNAIVDVSGEPVIAGGTVYAANQSGRAVALDAETGERRWTASEGAYGPAWPVGGAVFMVSDEGALLRLDAATGRVIWRTVLPEYWNEEKRIEAIAHYGPILAGGRLWVASGDETLRSFDPTTGRQLSSVPLPGGAGAPPAIAGGVMYIVSRDGKLLAFQ